MSSFKKKRSASFIDDSGASDTAPQATKKSKTGGPEPDGKDDDGQPYWDLSGKRRAGVSQFKNMCFVSIREYYDKDGKTLPGKKGISLTIEQYAALLKSVPGINTALKELGHAVDADGVDAPKVGAKPKEKMERTKKSSKANIEATSDEEED